MILIICFCDILFCRASCVPLLAALLPTTVQSQGCPFVERQTSNPNMIAAEDYLAAAHGHPTHFQRMMEEHQTEDHGEMEHEVPDYQAVMDEIEKLLTQSQDFWPGDFADTEFGPHYGGLFIRLAWHCAGSYRESDGRGGCDGGRIRFAPELEWPDNGNLDMALKLLEPIKETFGDSLSWGDLIILSGTTAIKAYVLCKKDFCLSMCRWILSRDFVFTHVTAFLIPLASTVWVALS